MVGRLRCQWYITLPSVKIVFCKITGSNLVYLILIFGLMVVVVADGSVVCSVECFVVAVVVVEGVVVVVTRGI